MEKSSAFKEEIYKIVKYQTKLASSNNIKESEMYRNKLNEHVQKMKMFGGSGSNVLNMVGGAGESDDLFGKFKEKIEQKKQAATTNTQSTIEKFKGILGDHAAQANVIVKKQKEKIEEEMRKGKECNDERDKQNSSLGEIRVETEALKITNAEIQAKYNALLEQIREVIDSDEKDVGVSQPIDLSELEGIAKKSIDELNSSSGLEQQQPQQQQASQ